MCGGDLTSLPTTDSLYVLLSASVGYPCELARAENEPATNQKKTENDKNSQSQ